MRVTDKASDMVTVSAHDLHRLLLQFRAELERRGARPGGWHHAGDWDESFERLADVIDARLLAKGGGRDTRTRCHHDSPVYVWPDDSSVTWVSLRRGSAHTSARLRHLVPQGDPVRRWKTLCGFHFIEEDLVKRPGSLYPQCETCEREQWLRGISSTQTETPT